MKKNILLGVSGSISAYKAADLINHFNKLSFNVNVVMTKNSTEFITPLTLQTLSKNIVHVNVMEEHSPKEIHHIDLAKQADLFLIAPATANIIAKLSNGIADDMLSTMALALKKNLPKMIAPAMNTTMYESPITQKNLVKLKQLGYIEIIPRKSLLACGDFGRGALATTESIVEQVKKILI